MTSLFGQEKDNEKEAAECTSIHGVVEHGDKVGRALGFPTANLHVGAEALKLAHGVYAGSVHILDGRYCGEKYVAAISLGSRPSVGGSDTRLESYLLDFDGDLYGTQIQVDLVRFIRPQLKCANMNDLIEAITRDVEKIRRNSGK